MTRSTRGDSKGTVRPFGRLESPGVLLRCPANVLGAKAPSSLADRCHSLRSLLPPPAALPSLPLRGRWQPEGLTDEVSYLTK